MLEIGTFFKRLQKDSISNFFSHRLIHILKKHFNDVEKSLNRFKIKISISRVPAIC